MKNVLPFLYRLKENNNRDWFHENKKLFEVAKEEVEDFVNHLIPQINTFDPAIGNLEAKKTMFRIYRDVRFSKDKTPYKTFFGAYMAPGGRKSIYAGYYLHIEPGGSFLAGGSHRPQGENLKKIRSEIYYNAAELKAIINSSDFKRDFGKIEGEKLKRPPVGFPKDFPDIELLKFKDFTLFHRFEDTRLATSDFNNFCLEVFQKMKPFNDFMNRALGMGE
ncbi:MAG: DUF2461 domain-containing protein [Bacteroidetes bacterium]|nr:MAG: DUF2461 domain-containing protein [Bacteroidota bacterium]